MTPEEWYRSLPPVSRIYWSAAVLTTILTTIKVVSPMWLYLGFDEVFGKFQIWRLLTNFFFFGPFSMSFIFIIVMLVRYCSMLESQFGTDIHGTAEFLTLLLFGVGCCWTLGYLLLPPQYFYGPALVFMVMYVWSRRDPYQETLFYGFSFKAWHTPFLFLVVGMLMGSNPILDLTGIGIGHLYYFCREIVPMNWGIHLIRTPQLIVDLVKYTQARWAGRPIQVNTAAPRPGWQQGQGYRLG